MNQAVHGYGHIRNTPSKRDRPVGELLARFGDATPLPTSEDNSGYLGAVRDQSITSSCVPHAGCKSVMGFAAARGMLIAELSPMAAYALTRGPESLPGAPLVDEGSQPRDFFVTAFTFGVVAESRYEFDPAHINDRLPIDVFEFGAEAHVDTFTTIFETGAARIDAIKAAVHAKLFPVFAMPVDLAYEQIQDQSTYPGLTGAVKGMHCQVICGFGPGYILVRGSWGIEFGFGGNVRISTDFMASDQVFDFMAASAEPGNVTP